MSKLSILEEKWEKMIKNPSKENTYEVIIKMKQQLSHERSKEYSKLKKDLKKVGIYIENIYDLVNTTKSYPEAIEYLVKYLPDIKHVKNKEGFIRALTVKEAKGKANKVLIEEFKKLKPEQYNLKFVIANALKLIAQQSDKEDLMSFINDKIHGDIRDELVQGLSKLKVENLDDYLISLLDDDEIAAVVIKILIRKKIKKAYSRISEMENHPDERVRKIVPKALIKLNPENS